jgi:site-specific DNA-methyltransferase (adenine-specific)
MVPFPNKKYKVIYADPPWSYRDKRDVRNKSNVSTAGRGVINHYNLMSIEEICKLPVQDISEEDSFLFMWTTFPQLQDSFKVIESWGFKYKTQAFTWIKSNKKSGTPFFGLGSYTRSNAEVCLLAVKGKPKVVSKSVSSVIISPREQHSKKPNLARTRIEQLCGDVPKIELFARETFAGWDCWGDEIKTSILNETNYCSSIGYLGD